MTNTMTGAESLVTTLVDSGIDTCFTNPGTSEMHFCAALDKLPGMRCVLGLFEGVVTGAADGYSRITGRPAATLLHLGPGLGNGLANLHNARRAGSPVVNIVGEHASFHLQYDAPLTSDIEGIARPVSHWVRTSAGPEQVAADGAEAVAAARTAPGQIATLILPADASWGPAQAPPRALPVKPAPKLGDDAIAAAAAALAGGGESLLLLGGPALEEPALTWAGAIAAKTGAKLMTTTFMRCMPRGAGRVGAFRLPYVVAQALPQLAPYSRILLVGAKPPVSFFGYPDSPSQLQPEGCEIVPFAEADFDIVDALQRLADRLGAKPEDAVLQPYEAVAAPSGPITPEGLGRALAALLPENAIVIDEAVTTGRGFYPATRTARPHHWLANLGGSIGFGTPVGTGAAIAAPDRKVICLEGDGSFMYTAQSLWTQARENCDVTTVIFANRSYNILLGEFAAVGAGAPGQRARDIFEIGRPDIDMVGLAKSLGVPGSRVDDLEGFAKAFTAAMDSQGPKVIEVMV